MNRWGFWKAQYAAPSLLASRDSGGLTLTHRGRGWYCRWRSWGRSQSRPSANPSPIVSRKKQACIPSSGGSSSALPRSLSFSLPISQLIGFVSFGLWLWSSSVVLCMLIVYALVSPRVPNSEKCPLFHCLAKSCPSPVIWAGLCLGNWHCILDTAWNKAKWEKFMAPPFERTEQNRIFGLWMEQHLSVQTFTISWFVLM